MIGGAIEDSSALTNQGFAYNPATNSWSSLPNSTHAVYRGVGACGLYKVGGSAGQLNPMPFAVRRAPARLRPAVRRWAGRRRLAFGEQAAFDVAPGHSVTVRVSLDSTVLDQPATYRARLQITTDSPYDYRPIAVTLTVNPPCSWGKLAGTVGDEFGQAIPGATVQVCTMYDTHTGRCGPVTYTLKTDAGGRYQLWLNKGYNPLQVVATTDDYQPQVKIVPIRKGKTTTIDFTLQRAS